MAMAISVSFGVLQLVVAPQLWWAGVINLVGAVIYAAIPYLHRFGELVAPLTFIGTAYVSIFIVCWILGTGSGLQLYSWSRPASWCYSWAANASSWRPAWQASPLSW
jgi:adenylate cyclase